MRLVRMKWSLMRGRSNAALGAAAEQIRGGGESKGEQIGLGASSHFCIKYTLTGISCGV